MAFRRHGRKRRPGLQFVPTKQTFQALWGIYRTDREKQAIPGLLSSLLDITHLFLIVQSIKIRVDKQDVLWLEVSVSQLVVM